MLVAAVVASWVASCREPPEPRPADDMGWLATDRRSASPEVASIADRPIPRTVYLTILPEEGCALLSDRWESRLLPPVLVDMLLAFARPPPEITLLEWKYGGVPPEAWDGAVDVGMARDLGSPFSALFADLLALTGRAPAAASSPRRLRVTMVVPRRFRGLRPSTAATLDPRCFAARRFATGRCGLTFADLVALGEEAAVPAEESHDWW